MELYYLIESAPCRSVLMTINALGIKVNRIALDLKKDQHRTAAFLKINPQHTTPTLVDCGFAIWESRAVMIYLVEKYGKDDTLYPKCPEKRALINQRLYFDLSLYPYFRTYYYPQAVEKSPADPELLEKLEEQLGFLNIFLKEQSFVAGDNLTIADITLLSTISTFDVSGIDLGKFSSVMRWYENCKQLVPGFNENWEGCVAFKKYY